MDTTSSKLHPGLMPAPPRRLSFSSPSVALSGDGAVEIDRWVFSDVLVLFTLPLRMDLHATRHVG
jgi:hypothetical protein